MYPGLRKIRTSMVLIWKQFSSDFGFEIYATKISIYDQTIYPTHIYDATIQYVSMHNEMHRVLKHWVKGMDK